RGPVYGKCPTGLIYEAARCRATRVRRANEETAGSRSANRERGCITNVERALAARDVAHIEIGARCKRAVALHRERAIVCSILADAAEILGDDRGAIAPDHRP